MQGLVAVFILAATAISAYGCPDGWDSGDGVCFKFFSEKKNFNDAEEACKSEGGNLACPQSEGENTAVHDLVGKQRSWIGIHDRDSNEGNFRCTSNEEAELAFTSWHKGEPNDWGHGEDCTELNRFSNSKGWNDIRCSGSKPFVCEIRGCPEGWKSEGGKCYKFVSEKKTFQEAQDICEGEGGNLACPTSEEENKAIHEMTDARSWIGIHDREDSEGTFRSIADDEAIDFTSWHAGEPNNVGKGGEDCTEINFRNWGEQYQWNDISCSRKQSFVCEYDGGSSSEEPEVEEPEVEAQEDEEEDVEPDDEPDDNTQEESQSCRDGWEEKVGKCYLSVTEKKDFQAAQKHCEDQGGHLACPKSEEENIAIVGLAGKERTWIGIHDTEENEGKFRCTSDDEELTFANWHAGEPNDWGKGEDCTEINFRNWAEQWNDIACSHKKPFVCESEKQCPEGSERKAGNCYKFVADKKTFNNAESDCEEQGGHLACPKSEEENKAIHDLAEGRTWIGIHDKADSEGKFRCTSDDKDLTFDSWHAGEPNDWGKGEDCTEINFRNWGDKQQWNDIACSHEKPYVCQFP